MPVVTIHTSSKYNGDIIAAAGSSVVNTVPVYEDIVQVTIISDTPFTFPETIPAFIPLKINKSDFDKTHSASMDTIEVYKQVVSRIAEVECTNVVFSTTKNTIIDFWHNDKQIWIDPQTLILYIKALGFIERFGNNIKLLTIDPLFDLLLRILKVKEEVIYTQICKVVSIIPETDVVIIIGNNDELRSTLIFLLKNMRESGWFSYVEVNPSIPIYMKEISRAYDLNYVDSSVEEISVPETETIILQKFDRFKPKLEVSVISGRDANSQSNNESNNELSISPADIDLTLQGDGYMINNNRDDMIYIQGNNIVRVDNIVEVYVHVISGGIPLLSITFDTGPFTEDYTYTVVLDSFAKTSEVMKLNTFSPIGFDSLVVKGFTATLPLSSKLMLDTMISHLKPIDSVNIKKFKDMDAALLFRAKLSTFNIRSITRSSNISNSNHFDDSNASESPITVCWFDNSHIPIASIEAVDITTESLRLSLVQWVLSQCREKMDPVTYNDFSDLTSKELVEVIITPDGYGYEMETYSKLNNRIDPMTRKLLISPETMKLYHGATGYFTTGPILGMYDTMPSPEMIRVDQGHVVTDIENYNTATEIYNHLSDTDTAAEVLTPNLTYKICHFSINSVDIETETSNNQHLVSLIIKEDMIPSVTHQLESLWHGGFFLSPWAASYYQLTNKVSNVDPIIPEIFDNSDVNETRSELVITYIKGCYDEYGK